MVSSISLTPPAVSPRPFSPASLAGGGSSLSSASSAFVADSTASFHSESLRWQAEMLERRTAMSYSRYVGHTARAFS